MHRVARLALSLLLPALCTLPRVASAQFDSRAWTTYLHAQTCRDLICLRDTVWIAALSRTGSLEARSRAARARAGGGGTGDSLAIASCAIASGTTGL